MQFLHRVVHVLTRFLQRVELGLLVRRQNRTDLRHRFVENGLCFLHRVLVDGDDLWPRLIEQRLDLGLLVRRQVQRLGQVLHRKLMSATAAVLTAEATTAVLRVNPSEATQRNRAGGSEGK